MASGGDDIEEIQEETGARVTFHDRDTNRDSKDDRTVIIRGSTEAAQKAELMIHQIISDMPKIITEEVEVPGYCLGRLIGRGGESIREMSRVSKCKIFIDRTQDSRATHAPRTITITGPQEQIQLAKTLIEEKVEEEEEFRAMTAVNAANREQRKPLKRRADDGREKISLPSRVVEPEGRWDSGDTLQQIVEASPVKEFMEVFVSAVEHPGHFWLQIINTAALNLDKLVDDMTAFYSNAEIAQEYTVTEVKEGKLVAAPFEHDKSWYRARVLSVAGDKLDLYYLDFGDSGFAPLVDVRELRPEYLSLPEQAIECKLAGVKPAGAEWSEETCDAFESLTHCAEWKVMSARTVGYEPDSAGRQRPCVQLMDNVAEQPVEVAAVLVSRGLAAWEAPPAAASAVTTETVSTDLQPQSDPKPD
ncbi:tudor and KH domain-containing protein-like isoform X2 [Littorina saxatilis]|uniref:Tudor domain-containing protein n=1 Tax=Littorina saxatilis TaxID=31220 RepID=A0AAN9B021_9CAEN